MKPSNTGRDWYDAALNLRPGPVYEAAINAYSTDFNDSCEWAAQIAIAEYRKEFAAKVERQRIRRPTRDGLAFNSAIEQVLHVINENDDE